VSETTRIGYVQRAIGQKPPGFVAVQGRVRSAARVALLTVMTAGCSASTGTTVLLGGDAGHDSPAQSRDSAASDTTRVDSALTAPPDARSADASTDASIDHAPRADGPAPAPITFDGSACIFFLDGGITGCDYAPSEDATCSPTLCSGSSSSSGISCTSAPSCPSTELAGCCITPAASGDVADCYYSSVTAAYAQPACLSYVDPYGKTSWQTTLP
jgi:hypothetical protein